ncbi:HET-domain-containing protein, partial [Glonium stellatum]
MSIPSSVTSISSPVTSISSLSISRYRHDPLAFEDSIRILVLEPGEYCEPVHCHLVPTRLSDTPIYDAISYVWGTDEPSNEVFICGKKFLIKTNLYNALRRFRHSPKKDGSQKASDHDLQRKLWVDVLCVNQADIPERNQQVQNMKRVYAGARSVLIWLRDSIESDRLAF